MNTSATNIPTRGLTLAEALVSLALVSLLLGIVATLMSSYAQMIRKSNESTTDVQPLQAALDMISADLRAAVIITSPAASASPPGLVSSDINLIRIDPWAVDRLPDPIPSTLPAEFLPHKSTWQCHYRYYLKPNAIWQYSYFPDGSVSDYEAFTDISGMSAQYISGSAISLQVSYQTVTTPIRVVSLSTIVRLQSQPVLVQ